MQAQELDRYVSLEVRIPNGDGFKWQRLAKVWAKKIPGPGREFYNGDQVLSDELSRFVTHKRTDMKPTMRLIDNGRIYNISAITDDDRWGRDFIVIHGTAGSNEG